MKTNGFLDYYRVPPPPKLVSLLRQRSSHILIITVK